MGSNRRLKQEKWFLHGLSPRVRQAFQSITTHSRHQNGAVLFAAGEAAQGIFVLRAGKVKIAASSNKGKSLVFRMAWPGEVLGLSATVTGNPHQVTAEAIGPCEADFVERADSLRFLDRRPEACFQVVQMLSHEVRGVNEQVRLLHAARSASGRLAMLLLTWCAESGIQTDDGIRLSVPLTEREIGQMLGASRETIARLLGKFRDSHIAEHSGRDFLILDKGALQGIARAQANGGAQPDQPRFANVKLPTAQPEAG